MQNAQLIRGFLGFMNLLFLAIKYLIAPCLQLTGDIHEEVEGHNRMLDRMVCVTLVKADPVLSYLLCALMVAL